MLQLCCGLSSWLLCLAKIHKVKQNWSVLRAPFLSNVLVTHVSLLKGNCRVFIFSTLKVVLHHLLLGLSCPQGNVHLDLSRSWRSKAPELFYSLGEQSLCCNRKKRTMTLFPDIFKGRRKKKKGGTIAQFLFSRIIVRPFLEGTFETWRNDRCGKTFGRKKRDTNVLPKWPLLPKRPWCWVGSQVPKCWHCPNPVPTKKISFKINYHVLQAKVITANNIFSVWQGLSVVMKETE